ncbi:MAG: hypothetical protein ACLUKQ_01075 [Peptococcaceae bacterium]
MLEIAHRNPGSVEVIPKARGKMFFPNVKMMPLAELNPNDAARLFDSVSYNALSTEQMVALSNHIKKQVK